jgi:hypothetical protein
VTGSPLARIVRAGCHALGTEAVWPKQGRAPQSAAGHSRILLGGRDLVSARRRIVVINVRVGSAGTGRFDRVVPAVRLVEVGQGPAVWTEHTAPRL